MKKIFLSNISMLIFITILSANTTQYKFFNNSVNPTDKDQNFFSGTIEQDTIWSDTIYVVGDVTINDGVTLTIDPGCNVLFDGHYMIAVQGRLLALGTETDSILFTVIDTTHFTNMSTGAGGWYGIRFDETTATNDSSKIAYCTLQYGKAVGGNYNDGGAIYIKDFKKILISNCTIMNNRSANDGGGIYFDFHGSGCVIRNSVIYNNYAKYGGAIACEWDTNPKIVNTKISNNSVLEKGGGIWCGWFSSPIIVNCIISNNNDSGIYTQKGNLLIVNSTITNNNYCGIYYHEEYFPSKEDEDNENKDKQNKNDLNTIRGFKIINTILWGNSIYEVYIVSDYYGAPDFYYCDVQDGANGIYGYNYVDIYENNIAVDPLYVLPSGGVGVGFDGLNADWSLQSSSCCINHGNPDTTGLYLPNNDLAGNPRVYDGILDIIDIGAYEYQGEPDPIPEIVIDPSTLSFGLCTVDSTSSVKNFIISNIGHSILGIDSIIAPIDFEVKREDDLVFNSTIEPFSIEAYHDTLINVVFKPTLAHQYSDNIMIKCNDPDEDTVFVNVTGTGTNSLITSGLIDNDTVWDTDTVKVVGSVDILDGVTLTINPGTIVEFQGKYNIDVQGRILAIGTESDTISFIAKYPTTGWSGIKFDETSITNDSSKFVYCKLKYSRYNGWPGGGLFKIIDYSKIIISNCLISNNSSEGRGGAIYCNHSSPIISNSSINNNNNISNFQESGGAIYLWYSSPVISNCLINNNSSWFLGGAILCSHSSPIISHCTINNNTCGGMGGAIAIHAHSSPIIKNSVIENNFADSYWDEYGEYPGFGGGIGCSGSDLTIDNSKIADNYTAFWIGAPSAGGGICFEGSSIYTLYLKIINSSIINNSAIHGASIYCTNSVFVNIVNSISWNNSTEEIYFSQIQDSNTVSISYSDIQGGEAGIVNGSVYWPQGNIDEDPLFEDGYHLGYGSPCIDTGTPDTTGLYLPPWDLDGNVRIWDGNGDSIAIIDMGCYEFGAPLYDVDEPVEPTEFVLSQNFPNPFSNTTNIVCNIPKYCANMQLKVYNIKGQLVQNLSITPSPSRSIEVTWNGKDKNGKTLSNGIYLYQLTGKNYTSKIMKMILIR